MVVTRVWGVLTLSTFVAAVRVYDDKRLAELRDEVKSVFYHGYNNYIEHAYPYDELRPLSCDGVDTWGSYSLTLIDTLDTLAVVGNYSEFRRVANLIIENAHFDMNINVSVFETNIRILGGLLSAHLFSQKAGMEVEEGWPCRGPLLRLAETVGRKLLPAFDTETGMPYGTVNLRYGVPPNETPVTCTAGVGTFIVEFGALSRLTGDMVYEKVALKALHALYSKRSNLDLVGNHIDTKTGKWTAIDAGIGAGVDSYFEYLVKGAILFQRPELMHMFRVFHRAIEKHLGKGGWYVWATMGQGHVSATTFQSLVGEFKSGIKAMTNYHRILKQYGGLPELYNILQGKATHQREGYPLRPELIESAMYLYRATKDPAMLELGEDVLHSLQYNARTECGYATIRDVTTLTLEDRMESFFLAETVKYLYLLFDPVNFIHNEGEDFTVVSTPFGKCTVYAGGYIFNTEAHPIDVSALNCCTGVKESDLHKEIQIIDEVRSSQVFPPRKKINVGQKSLKSKKPKNVNIITKSLVASKLQHNLEPPQNFLTIVNQKCARPQNPLLNFKKDQFIIPRVSIDLSSTQMTTVTSDSENVVFKLLKKLLEEQPDYKELLREGFQEGVAKGLQFVSSNDAKDLQRLVESFDVKIRAAGETGDSKKKGSFTPPPNVNDAKGPQIVGTGTSVQIDRPKIENRILVQSPSGQLNPDLDLIFGSAQSRRSLSFYFSLKWLPSFPDLLKQLIPSESFDIQNFYRQISRQDYSSETFSKKYNFSERWINNFNVLRCPNWKIPDRFAFFRSSVEE